MSSQGTPINVPYRGPSAPTPRTRSVEDELRELRNENKTLKSKSNRQAQMIKGFEERLSALEKNSAATSRVSKGSSTPKRPQTDKTTKNSLAVTILSLLISHTFFTNPSFLVSPL